MGKLESRNIEKYFTHDGKPLKTLDGINVNVEDGEFVCIVGPSGCGKIYFSEDYGRVRKTRRW
uniref:ABC-type antimicrobial peptide transport system, ATPase component (ABC.SN.A) n=1 Tax=uncultured marine thaumarchaeote SAT1000_10_F12 TaxID=1456373 RepID=A0A075I7M0_9ARCH|nr:ABC-type antimicrobial peptide transport system, ATPase component (ABC.SN.A) [uncultured marine thaumarchaeote SAT1000_10_F12]